MNELLAAAKKLCDEFSNLPVDTTNQRVALIDLRTAVNNAEHDLRKAKKENSAS